MNGCLRAHHHPCIPLKTLACRLYPTVISVARNDHLPVHSLRPTHAKVKGDPSLQEFVCRVLMSLLLS